MEKTRSQKIKNSINKFRLRPAHKVMLGFLAMIFIGSFFLSLPIASKDRVWTDYLTSLFTSFSAVCLTGMSAAPVAPHYSAFGQAVILILIQFGAIGIMSVAGLILLLMKKKISFKNRLSLKDSLNMESEKGVTYFFKKLLIMTFSFELAGAVMLMPALCAKNGAIGVWQSVFLAVSAFCNTGFDLFGTPDNAYASLSAFQNNPYVLIVVALLVIAGGIGFIVIVDLAKSRGKFKKLSPHSKTVLSAALLFLLTGTVFFLCAEYNNPLTIGNMNFFQKLLNSFFQSASMRTGGFSSFSQTGLTSASKIFLCGLMFIGASPGSTGGGIKTTTFAVIILSAAATFKDKGDTVIFKHTVNKKIVRKAAAVFLLSSLLVFTLAVFLLISESGNSALTGLNVYSPENIILEAFATVSTCGISAGITPYLSAAGKTAVMITMFLSRIGLLNFGTAMLRDSAPDIIVYPESNIYL